MSSSMTRRHLMSPERVSAPDVELQAPCYDRGRPRSASPRNLVHRKRHVRVIRQGLIRRVALGLVPFGLAMLAMQMVLQHRLSNGNVFHGTGVENLRLSPRASVDQQPYLVAFPRAKGNRPVSRFNMLLPREGNASRPDYGHLNIAFLENEGVKRVIYHDVRLDQGRITTLDDDNDNYYAYDDDFKRNPYSHDNDNHVEKEDKRKCRRVNWHRGMPINCNTIYEMDFGTLTDQGRTFYVGGGSYREVYSVDLVFDELVVFKTTQPSSDFDYTEYEFIRMDSLVSSLSSPNHPYIVDIYGYCGMVQIAEAVPNGEFELLAVPMGGRNTNVTHNDTTLAMPQNAFTPSEKLFYALEMAEAIALLHGYPDGVIVHDDIHLRQFLLTEGYHLKLNDFNRAEIMLWDAENQEYCRYKNHPGRGVWRAPEEYFDRRLNEKIDVFSYGNNLFSLLTGAYPFPSVTKTSLVKQKVKSGEKPFLHPVWCQRSFMECKIVELIPHCYEYDIDKRISIFKVVQFLRSAIEEAKQKGEWSVLRNVTTERRPLM